MAMRIFSEKQFHAELQKYGFSITPYKTKNSQIWTDRDNEVIMVPYGLDYYPDYILDEALHTVGKLYAPGNVLDYQVYEIEPSKPAVKFRKE